MCIKEKIIQTLKEASGGLTLLEDDFFIFGSAALILSGIEVGSTKDIDLLTSACSAGVLKRVWGDYRLDIPQKKSGLFRSDRQIYQFHSMQVEVSGDLQILKDGDWVDVRIHDYELVYIDDFAVKVPSLREQKRLLELFGREKDLQRLNLIDRYLNKGENCL